MAGAGDGYLQKDKHTQGELSAGCGSIRRKRRKWRPPHTLQSLPRELLLFNTTPIKYNRHNLLLDTTYYTEAFSISIELGLAMVIRGSR